MLSEEFEINSIKYLIRPFNSSDNLNEYKILFKECDNVLNKGINENNKILINIGLNYIENTFNNDLNSFNSIETIYFNNLGVFWLLFDITELNNIKIIGSIALEDKLNNIYELRRMCISYKYRRNGLGSKLIKHLLNYANYHNFNRIYLTTPLFNINAIDMYCKNGFILENTTIVNPGEINEIEIATLAINKPRNEEVI